MAVSINGNSPPNGDYTYKSLLESVKGISKELETQQEMPEVQNVYQKSEEIIKIAESKHNFWTDVVSFFLGLVGIVSDYRRLQTEIQNLDTKIIATTEEITERHLHALDPSFCESFELPESTEELENQLKILEIERAFAFQQLEKASEPLQEKVLLASMRMQSIEKGLNNWMKSSMASGANSYITLMTEKSEIASALSEMQSVILELKYFYHENDEVLATIKPLVIHYELTVRKFKEYQKVLTFHSVNETDMSDEAQWSLDFSESGPIAPVAGIYNGGNTCYLASAIQTLNNISLYRRAFDPTKNELKQREAETDDSFEERKAIQRLTHGVVEKINQGKTVSRNEINRLRNACFAHKIDGVGVSDRNGGMGDAVETLQRMLTAMDYDSPMFAKKHTTILGTELGIVEGGSPSEYRTLEERNNSSNYERLDSIELSGFAYLGSTVSMQQLVENYWMDEEIAGVKFRELNEEGIACVKKYNITLKKTPFFENAPPVMRLTVTQPEFEKAILTDVRTIHPFGLANDGPAYHLKAVIEQRPGHYVAHVIDQNGEFFEANDSTIYSSQEDLPGLAYYYVRADIATEEEAEAEISLDR